MGQSYKLSVLGASLVNGDCLTTWTLEDRVVNASKYLTWKKQIAISMPKNESLYYWFIKVFLCKGFYKDIKKFKLPFSCVSVNKRALFIALVWVCVTLSDHTVRHF